MGIIFTIDDILVLWWAIEIRKSKKDMGIIREQYEYIEIKISVIHKN